MHINKTFKIFLLLFLFTLICGVVYAQENLEGLRQSLLEQEKELESGNGTKEQGNSGYLYNKDVQEVNEVKKAKPKKKKIVKNPERESIPEARVVESSETVSVATVDGQINVEELYREARALYNQNKFKEAKEKAEEIIKLNPLYVPAYQLVKMSLDNESDLLFKDNAITTKEKMLESGKAWLPPVYGMQEEEEVEEKAEVQTYQRKLMEEKARQIIPEINFTDAHIRDVLKYLSDISGINIVIDEDLFPNMSWTESVPDEVEVDSLNNNLTEFYGSQGALSSRITISLMNIPLIEALKYILSVKGLKFRIDEYAIVVSTPERLSAVEMETRYYHLSAGVGIFTEFVKKVREEEQKGDIYKGLKEEARITIKDVLEQSGVPFPTGSKVFLDKRIGTLIVRNTPQNLRLVEEILRMLDVTPFQVEIEARFVELNESTAQELGLEWMITNDYLFYNNKMQWDSKTTDPQYGAFPDPTGVTGRQGLSHGMRYLHDANTSTGNILSISGVLTKPQFKMILHALNQEGFANLLSAPKVTTLNNQQAQIEVVREIVYPTEFELTPATTNDSGNVVTQPVVTPVAWTTRDVGIILNVTPSVGADKKTVNLNLNPEVSKFQEWEDYGIQAGVNWSAIPIKQPIFFTQNVETNVVIHDGETVVLGGLIREIIFSTEDKIPLLGDIPLVGRLFRTETETTEKKNLVIFVTANLLTPTGERINH